MSEYQKGIAKNKDDDEMINIYNELTNLCGKVSKINNNQNKENAIEFLNELKIKTFIHTQCIMEDHNPFNFGLKTPTKTTKT